MSFAISILKILLCCYVRSLLTKDRLDVTRMRTAPPLRAHRKLAASNAYLPAAAVQHERDSKSISTTNRPIIIFLGLSYPEVSFAKLLDLVDAHSPIGMDKLLMYG